MWFLTYTIVTLIVCLTISTIFPAEALETCITEPADMVIEYGDTFSCSIESTGDSDVFHFLGSLGDRISATAARTGGAGNFRSCITLVDPNGATVGEECASGGNRIDTVLNQVGTFTIVVFDNDNGDQGTYEVTLACLGGPCITPAGDADIVVTPPNADFGPVALSGASPPLQILIKNIVVKNNGIGPRLRVESIVLEGRDVTDFRINRDECSNRFLAPGLICAVELVFSPQLIGTKTATLLITSNDPDTSQVEVMLSGVGASEEPEAIGGSVTGMSPTNVVCTNLSTGQSVTIPNSARVWDCSASGLDVSTDDTVFQGVIGTAD